MSTCVGGRGVDDTDADNSVVDFSWSASVAVLFVGGGFLIYGSISVSGDAETCLASVNGLMMSGIGSEASN